MWIIGACWVIYAMSEHLLKFERHKILKEYAMLLFCFIMGFAFLYKGKIRTIVFDKT